MTHQALYNFGAGPAMLPAEVVRATAQAVTNFQGMGLSLMEIGHRTPQFKAVMAEAQQLMRELLHIPATHSVLFLGGGARLQFSMVPMNLLKHKAAYLDSGHWAHQAMTEARLWGETLCVASTQADHYTHLPHHYHIPTDVDYLHITTNNTIYGTELRTDIDSPVPLVADMSSDILTRPIDVSRYDLIYGGAQKNLSMAGVTFVIVRNEAVIPTPRPLPAMLSYATHIQHEGMYNTPPMLPIYTALQTLRWIKAQGGVCEMERRAKERAQLLYAAIDASHIFHGTAQHADRSLMNICFVLNEGYQHLEDHFTQFALDCGIYAIKGHRSVGGFRASCYNAMPIAGVEALAQCIRDFEQTWK